MNIKKVRNGSSSGRFVVTYTPNWLERLFGMKEKEVKYKDSGEKYTRSQGAVYINKAGERLDHDDATSIAIDNWRRRW